MDNHATTYQHLKDLSAEEGLAAVEEVIIRLRIKHKSEVAYLQKLAQSYRAKVRWKREEVASKVEPDPVTGERVLKSVDDLSPREFDKFLQAMRDR